MVISRRHAGLRYYVAHFAYALFVVIIFATTHTIGIDIPLLHLYASILGIIRLREHRQKKHCSTARIPLQPSARHIEICHCYAHIIASYFTNMSFAAPLPPLHYHGHTITLP